LLVVAEAEAVEVIVLVTCVAVELEGKAMAD
jgi:hypothetical protein